jgi:cystathionine beta-lyase/cystathionine gamma-synthase
MSDDELAAAGISAGLLRISVGLEDLEDLQEDFSIALEAGRAVARQAAEAADRPAVGV